MFCSGWELLKDPIGDVTRAPLTLKDAIIFVVVVVVVETKLRRQQQTARNLSQVLDHIKVKPLKIVKI